MSASRPSSAISRRARSRFKSTRAASRLTECSKADMGSLVKARACLGRAPGSDPRGPWPQHMERGAAAGLTLDELRDAIALAGAAEALAHSPLPYGHMDRVGAHGRHVCALSHPLPRPRAGSFAIDGAKALSEFENHGVVPPEWHRQFAPRRPEIAIGMHHTMCGRAIREHHDAPCRETPAERTQVVLSCYTEISIQCEDTRSRSSPAGRCRK